MSPFIKHLFKKFTINTLYQAKRVARIVIGITLLIIGLLMVVLPGPATVVIPLALSILAGEFIWARWLMKRFNKGLLYLLGRNSKKGH